MGGEDQRELIKLPAGVFNKVESVKNDIQTTVLMPDASICIERDRKQYEFVLVVAPPPALEEKQTRKKSSPGPVSLNATIRIKIQPTNFFTRCYNNEGDVVFRWEDASDPTFKYEFVVKRGTTATTIEMFHLIYVQCLYSTVEKKSSDVASDEELKALMLIESNLIITEDVSKDDKFKFDPNEVISFESDSCLFYVFEPESGLFVPKAASTTAVAQEDCKAIISSLKVEGTSNGKQFYLNVISEGTGEIIHRQLIDADATLHTDRNTGSYVWAHVSMEGSWQTFSLRFDNIASLMRLSNAMGTTILEILNGDKMEEEDVGYLLDQLNLDEKTISSSYAPSSEDDDSEEEDQGDASDEYSDEDDSALSNLTRVPGNEINQQLAVGYKNDRSFVSRGSAISVFRHTNDDGIEHFATIDGIKAKSRGKDQLINPSKMMLHEEDKSMILIDGNRKGILHKMDLEYGKVVEEWQVHPREDVGVTTIIPDSKYAQMTNNQTFLGINDNSIFRIDPRLSGPVKRVDGEMKEYKTKLNFTCAATTGKGEIAVANAKGEVRLYNRPDKIAKTSLPGFGDPVLGIDSTENGKWVVATCKSYLMLINTEISPGEGVSGILGFTKSMRNAEKPAPIRLHLKPEHVAYMKIPVSFTPARFSTGQSEERSIITSTGPYVITWSMRRVKQGHLYDYQIRKYEDTVVADNFRFGQDRNIVVTLPHHVTMISKRSLATPSTKYFQKTQSKSKE